LRVETYQFVFSGERNDLADNLPRLFDLDCHDHVVSGSVNGAGSGARIEFIFGNSFYFREEVDQVAVEVITRRRQTRALFGRFRRYSKNRMSNLQNLYED
jgi:hypothetical protein